MNARDLCSYTKPEYSAKKKFNTWLNSFFFLVVTLHLSINMVCAQAAWKAARKITEFKCQYFGLLFRQSMNSDSCTNVHVMNANGNSNV